MTLLFHLPTEVPLIDSLGQMSPAHKQLFTNLTALLNRGVPAAKNNANGNATPQSVTIPIAKLTSGGTNGSLTFTNGILTGYVAPV